MKYLYVIAIVTATITILVFFDAIVVFLLSGFIPGLNVTLAPSTMLAVLIASTLLVSALKRSRVIYQYCLRCYDEFLGIRKKKDEVSADDTKANLPRRRYQEL